MRVKIMVEVEVGKEWVATYSTSSGTPDVPRWVRMMSHAALEDWTDQYQARWAGAPEIISVEVAS